MSFDPSSPPIPTLIQSLDTGRNLDEWQPVGGKLKELRARIAGRDQPFNVEDSPTSVHIEQQNLDMALHREGTKDLTLDREFRFIEQTEEDALFSVHTNISKLMRSPVDRIVSETRVVEGQNWDASICVTSRRLRGYRVFFLTAPGIENKFLVYETEACGEEPAPSQVTYEISYR